MRKWWSLCLGKWHSLALSHQQLCGRPWPDSVAAKHSVVFQAVRRWMSAAESDNSSQPMALHAASSLYRICTKRIRTKRLNHLPTVNVCPGELLWARFTPRHTYYHRSLTLASLTMIATQRAHFTSVGRVRRRDVHPHCSCAAVCRMPTFTVDLQVVVHVVQLASIGLQNICSSASLSEVPLWSSGGGGREIWRLTSFLCTEACYALHGFPLPRSHCLCCP